MRAEITRKICSETEISYHQFCLCFFFSSSHSLEWVRLNLAIQFIAHRLQTHFRRDSAMEHTLTLEMNNALSFANWTWSWFSRKYSEISTPSMWLFLKSIEDDDAFFSECLFALAKPGHREWMLRVAFIYLWKRQKKKLKNIQSQDVPARHMHRELYLLWPNDLANECVNKRQCGLCRCLVSKAEKKVQQKCKSRECSSLWWTVLFWLPLSTTNYPSENGK